MDLFWLLLRSRGNDWRSRTGIVFSKEKTHPRFPEANRQYALTDGSELRFKDYPLRSYGPLFVKHNWCSYLKLSDDLGDVLSRQKTLFVFQNYIGANVEQIIRASMRDVVPIS
jgi:hypothetical protein